MDELYKLHVRLTKGSKLFDKFEKTCCNPNMWDGLCIGCMKNKTDWCKFWLTYRKLLARYNELWKKASEEERNEYVKLVEEGE